MTGFRVRVCALACALLASMSVAGCGSEKAEGNPPPPPLLLAIGDSWITGGSMNSGPTWPHLLDLPSDWTVLTDAMGGSGYMGDEPAMALTFDGRLDAVLAGPEPGLVIVAMGRNDVQEDPAAVARVARADLTRIAATWPEAEVVVFSPFSPEVPQPWTIALTGELEGVAESLGMEFLDVSGIILGREKFIGDSHPNDRGHALIARKVEAGLRDLGVFPVD